MTTVRDDTATMAGATATVVCPVCASTFERAGRQRFCSTECRQTAWRRQRHVPVEPMVTRSDTVYECPSCEARYLGEQRCDDCNTWCRRVGPGGCCPNCDEPVSVTDLLAPGQFIQSTSSRSGRR